MVAKGNVDPILYKDFSLELDLLSTNLRDFSHSLYKGERNIALNLLTETKRIANNMVKPTDECQIIINYSWPNNIIGLKRKDLNGLLDIIKEGIVNAMKNGNAKRIYLDFWEEEKFRILRVEDNGTGFNFVHLNISNSLGIKMIKKRANSLNALLEIKSTEGIGTTIYLKIPNK